MEDSVNQSIIVDKHGNPWGPFENAIEAARWAKTKWPDQEQDQDHPGIRGPGKGWDCVALRAPN